MSELRFDWDGARRMIERECDATSEGAASGATPDSLATTRVALSRRSFIARFVALAVSPVAVILASRGPDAGTEARRPAPDYSRVTWGNIPMNDESVDKIVLLSKRRTVVLTRAEYHALQERNARRA